MIQCCFARCGTPWPSVLARDSSAYLFYSLIAYVIVKTRYRGRWLLDFLSWLPWSIPGILLGVALLWTFLQTKIFLPIYGTIYLLMVAMVIKEHALRHSDDQERPDCNSVMILRKRRRSAVELGSIPFGASFFH